MNNKPGYENDTFLPQSRTVVRGAMTQSPQGFSLSNTWLYHVPKDVFLGYDDLIFDLNLLLLSFTKGRILSAYKALYEMLLSYLPAWAKQWDGHIFMNTGCSVNINMPLCGVYIFFLLLPLFVFFLSLNAFLIRAAELFQTFLI